MMTTSLHMVPSGAIIFNVKVTNIKHLKTSTFQPFLFLYVLQKDSQKTMSDKDDVNLTKLFR